MLEKESVIKRFKNKFSLDFGIYWVTCHLRERIRISLIGAPVQSVTKIGHPFFVAFFPLQRDLVSWILNSVVLCEILEWFCLERYGSFELIFLVNFKLVQYKPLQLNGFSFLWRSPKKAWREGCNWNGINHVFLGVEDRRFKPQFKFYKPNFFHDNYIPVFCFLWNWDFTVAKWYIFMQGEWETVDGDCIWFIAWLRIHWCTDLECSLLNQ